ncbi:MAG: 2-oxoisovalerate dehydrogenase [Firmicutes bacterium]|nr:2-oxoisovalerate dehydrogenase [Bacillota bacterium]
MSAEIIFLVEPSEDGGYTAMALGHAIFTQGDSEAEVERNVKEAVRCHFEPEERPKVVRLHYVRDVVISL